MATYIQGVTDYIPEVQPWSPDYNFYQNALERKQGQYDQGWQQVNTVYNSILNAPMMRADNNQTRDNFFKNIEGQIQQMSSVDLSLQQNVDAAAQVFKPFYEDKNIVHDIGFTKRYQDEMSNAEYFRNCTDDKKCGGKYWSGGVRLMQHQAEDFVNANADDALRMSAPRYVPFANLMDKATEAIKKIGGFNIEREHDTGKWIVKEKGGKQAIVPLMDFMQSRFGDDPELTDFFRAKASLLRYEDPEKAIQTYELAQLQSQAKDEAEFKQLVKEKVDKKNLADAKKVIAETDQKAKSGLRNILDEKTIIESNMKRKGIVPGSPEDKRYREIINSEPTVVEGADRINKIANSAGRLTYVDDEGKRISNDALDGVVANAMMMREMVGTANTIAYKDYQVTMKVNPYAAANHQHALNQQRDLTKHKYKLKEDVLKGVQKSNEARLKFLQKGRYVNPMAGKPVYGQAGAALGFIDPAEVLKTMDFLIEKRGMDPAVAAAVAQGHYSGVTIGSGKSEHESFRTKEGNQSGVTMPSADLETAIVDEQQNMVMLPDSAATNALVQTAIQDAKNGLDPTSTAVMVTTDNHTARMAATTDSWISEAKVFQEEFTIPRLNTILDKGANPNAESFTGAKKAIEAIGDLIQENRRKGVKVDKSLKDFPTSDTSDTYDPAYIRKVIASGKITELIDAAGPDALYNIMVSKKVPTVIRSYSGSELIDPREADIISKREYESLSRKAAFTNSGFPRKDGNDNFKPEFIGFADLEKIKRYEYVQDAPRINTQDLSLSSTIPEISTIDNYTADQISLHQARLTAAKMKKEKFQRETRGAVETMTEYVRDEEASFASKAFNILGYGIGGEKALDNAAKFVEDNVLTKEKTTVGNFIRENIWDDFKTDKWGGLASLNTLYDRAASLNDKTIERYQEESYGSGVKAAAFTLATGFMAPVYGQGALTKFLLDDEKHNTIPEIEEDFVSGTLANEGVKNMLANSQLVLDYNPPRDLDQAALLATMGKDADTSKEGLFRALLKHPDTKINRQGQTVTLESPFLKGELPEKYDLNKIEVSNTFGEIFSDIYEEVGPIRNDYINLVQGTDEGAFKDSAGIYNDAVVGMGNIKFQPGQWTPTLEQFTELFTEVEKKYDTDLKKYGIEETQGSKELLSVLMNATRNPDYKNLSNNPLWTITDFKAQSEHPNVAKVTIELDPAIANKYLKDLGFGKTGVEIEGSETEKTHGLTIPTTATFYIPNSESKIVKKAKPDPYTTLIELSPGESYTDNSLKGLFGGEVTYTLNAANQIETTYQFETYNGVSNEIETHTEYGDPVPLRGQDWEMRWKNNVAFMQNRHREKLIALEIAKEEGRLITSPEDYKTE